MEKRDPLDIASDNVRSEHERHPGSTVFVVSNRPLVPEEARKQTSSDDYENLGELPNSYGQPILFGMARDPQTLFVYWEIDWKKLFADKPPVDRKAYLFVTSADGSEKIRVAVEPLERNHLVAVSQTRTTYRIELGYYEPGENWRSVITADSIPIPPNDVSKSGNVEVATIPFHLSFHQIIEALRGVKFDPEALSTMIARLQKALDDSGAGAMPQLEGDALRAIESTLTEKHAIERSRLRNAKESFVARDKIDSILSSGPSSR
jgi:hypothetical protein